MSSLHPGWFEDNDWFNNRSTTVTVQGQGQDSSGTSEMRNLPEESSNPILNIEASPEPVQDGAADEFENVIRPKYHPTIQVNTQSPPDRLVNRKLRGIHLTMITVNGVLGTGLYWRGGLILELGGPLSVLLSFLLLGLLAWAVMQCITEMLCIWPVPGALSSYVSEFVDEELGITVGIAYWFTYSVSFAALIAITAEEVHYWTGSNYPGLDGGFLYLIIPIIMIFINLFGIEVYGWIEVVTGSIKIVFYLTIVIVMVVISATDPESRKNALDAWSAPTDAIDKGAAGNWATAFFMCLSSATFAFVGVEIVAASALEARWPTPAANAHEGSNRTSIIGRTVRFSAIWISVLATIAYVVGGILASVNIPHDAPGLPRLPWLNQVEDPTVKNTSSAFVLIANHRSRALADATNAFIVFTAVTCANTNLYVASRALFGLTSRLDGGPQQKWYIRPLAWLGRTNRRMVPMRAMVVSALAFCWVPFLKLSSGASLPITLFTEILSEMGSIGVVIVWACNCWAFIRYYNCISTFKVRLEEKSVPHVRRWETSDWYDYPYRSHGQPLLAYLALFGCLFILLVSNGSVLWHKFEPVAFLYSYLVIIIFVFVWVILKLMRGSGWSLVDLSTATKVENKIRRLHERSFPG